MKKLLIVVDYQNDFIDGSLGFDESAKLANGILKRVQYYVKNKQDIVFTMDSHDNNYLNTIEGK
jgi:nicotinamidase-related amidase